MKMRKELNNKGFSLVELLIATIILGIVVTPLLHSFVTAASVTARSRQMGDATLVSENIAETVVTTSLAQLFDETDPSKYFAGATKKALYSYDGSTYTEITTPTTANQYYLGVQGVQAGSSTFNAMIKLDANAYSSNGSRSDINDVKLSDYSKMDALYAQSLDVTNPDVLAWSAFLEEVDEEYDDGEWDPDSAEPVRTMILDIIPDKEYPDKISVLLRMEYTYTFDYYDTDEETGEPIRREDSITIDPIRYAPMDAFSETTNGRLPNIYVMYYPLYESASVTNDIIRINNMVNMQSATEIGTDGQPKLVPNPNGEAKPFKIFLVKEETKTSSGAKDPNLATKEYNYMATVEQYVPAGTPDTKYAVIYSNIREDLATGSNLGNKVTYDIYRGNYFSIKGRFGGDNPSNDANYKGGDLVSRSKYNRIFDVTVEIFDAEDTAFATPIHTFHATKLQ